MGNKKIDAYDQIRLAIWKFREEKRAVGIGVVFAWNLSDVILDTIQDGGFGHFMYATGWNEKGLEVVNSYGKQAGQNGKHFISREVINHFVNQYGAYMMIDLPKEEVVKLIAQRKKNKIREILSNLWNFFLGIINPDRLRTGGLARSPHWNTARKMFLKKYPTCAICGTKEDLSVHHIKPFHLDPSLELHPGNLITLCEKNGCHLRFGHLYHFKSYNTKIESDSVLWYNKIKQRP